MGPILENPKHNLFKHASTLKKRKSKDILSNIYTSKLPLKLAPQGGKGAPERRSTAELKLPKQPPTGLAASSKGLTVDKQVQNKKLKTVVIKQMQSVSTASSQNQPPDSQKQQAEVEERRKTHSQAKPLRHGNPEY